ncbi:hypothetical protein A2U01_0079725, partial [Trifolium medium]|nr:hypothetical protein [Trifolium medium]
VPTILYVGTGKVCWGVACWVLMGQEDWRPSCCFVLPMVNPCLSHPERYSSSRGGTFEGI